MATLSISQILGLAQNAGWSGPDLATAVAIALAESSGNPQNYNPEVAAGAAAGQGSFGLWQIYLTKHPEFDPNQLVTDPQYNADAAFSVYQAAGNSFRPWTTFTHGQYLKYLDQVNAVIAASAPAPADQTATDGTTADDNTDGSSTPPAGASGSTVGIVVATAAVLALFLYLRG